VKKTPKTSPEPAPQKSARKTPTARRASAPVTGARRPSTPRLLWKKLKDKKNSAALPDKKSAKVPGKDKPSPAKSNATCWIGFDLGGTKMLATVFDAQFRALGSKRRKTRGNVGARAGLERICETIDAALAEAGVRASQLGGIGVGCPGPLDLDRGIVLDMPNLGWKRFAIKRALEKRFKCPSHILNDVDAGVYGESVAGAGVGARSIVGVFPGTGIGGGAVYKGEIIRGSKGSCMEIGHLPVLSEGPLCGCGQRGCLEAVASRLAISGEAAKAAFRGQAPYLLSKAGTDISKIRSGTLAESIENGDVVIEKIIRQAARLIGITMAGIVNLMAPDILLLGGGLVEAMPKLFIEEVGIGIEQTAMEAYRGTYKLVVAKLGDDAGVIGSAAWARHSAS